MTSPNSLEAPNVAETASSGAKRKLVGRILFVLSLVVLVGGIPLGYRLYRLQAIPSVEEPFDLAAAGTISVPPGENAFDLYTKAVASLRPMTGQASQELEKSLKGTWDAVHPDVRKWLDDNRAAVDLYRLGSELPDAVYIQPKDYSYSTILSVIQEMRTLTRLASLQTMRFEAEGDDQGAWEMQRAILRTAQHCGRHGCGIERLVGAALQSVAEQSAVHWAENPRVGAALLRSALQDVRALRGTASPISETLKVEYLVFRTMTAKLNSAEGWREMDLHLLLPTAQGRGFAEIEKSHGFLIGEPELSRRVARLTWTNWLSQVDRPRFQRSKSGAFGLFPLNPALPKSPNLYSDADISKYMMQAGVARLFTPAVEHYVRRGDLQAANLGLLELTLALQLYAREHGGAYPATVEGLQPGYVSDLPVDPFGTGVPLQYRRESKPDGFTVWSVGPDGIDGGGKAVYDGLKGDPLIRIPQPKVAEAADNEKSKSP